MINNYLKTPQANFAKRPLKTAFIILFIFTLQQARSQSIPLINGFAHNDYRHRHPLFDALENGYTNIEADIFLRRGKLIVAHIDPYFKRHHTLEALYLKPLADRIAANNGQVYRGYNAPIILMIDVKSNPDSTYAVLRPLLEKYKTILSGYNHGLATPGAVTIVLSGHKPYKMIKSEDDRFAFIDEDLRKASQDTASAGIYKMASCKYSKLLKWNGKGIMPDKEQRKLCAFVAAAHKFGEKVRLWASPENDKVWTALLKCGVDLINTDKLVTLKNFLNGRKNTTIVSASNVTDDDDGGVLTL